MLSRIEEEKKTIEQIIRLYCQKKEGNKELCPKCRELLDFAHMRLTRCPYGDGKPTCKLCPIHCYKQEMKERMRIVMKYTGPRMLLYHPMAAMRHLWREYAVQYLSNLFGEPFQEQHKQ